MEISVDLAAVSPEIILAATGILVLVADMFLSGRKKTALAALAVFGVVLAGAAAYMQIDFETGKIAFERLPSFVFENGEMHPVLTVSQNYGRTIFAMGPEGDGSVVVDNFAVVFRLIFLLGTGLTVLLSVGYLQREDYDKGEFYALLLFCTIGMMVMASAADLLTLFLGLETLSIPLYVLAGFQRRAERSNEAGLKYLLMGAFASGFLLYGMAFIFGSTGTLRLRYIAEKLHDMATVGTLGTEPFLLVGTALLFVGLAFKIAAVPFHMWTPDVYEGAPTPVTAYMSVAVKAAAFAAMLRVLLTLIPFSALVELLIPALWWLSVLTMTVGNILGLVQSNIKRMLAYSSIAHAGYILVGVLAALHLGSTKMALASVLFYLIAYTLMNIGAFAVVLLVARKGDKFENIDDFNGLGKRHPVLAAGMALFLLSLTGIPPTAGFFGKFYLFGAAVSAGLVPLVVIAVLNSLISVGYYLRPIMAMYFKPSAEDESERGEIEIPAAAEFALYFTSTAVLLIGIIPNRIIPLVSSIISGL